MNYVKEIVTDKFGAIRVREVLADAFTKLEDESIPVDKIILSPQLYKYIRKYFKDEFDPNTAREQIVKGFVGVLWNAEVWVEKKENIGEIVVIGEGK